MRWMHRALRWITPLRLLFALMLCGFLLVGLVVFAGFTAWFSGGAGDGRVSVHKRPVDQVSADLNNATVNPSTRTLAGDLVIFIPPELLKKLVTSNGMNVVQTSGRQGWRVRPEFEDLRLRIGKRLDNSCNQSTELTASQAPACVDFPFVSGETNRSARACYSDMDQPHRTGYT
jgi:hypothetical protein